MIRVTFYKKLETGYFGFCFKGHAGYAEAGQDIVCAAVSVLSINTINAIEQLTDTDFLCDADEQKGGYLKVILSDMKKRMDCHDAEILLKAMAIGLEDLSKQYKKYIRLQYEEV